MAQGTINSSAITKIKNANSNTIKNIASGNNATINSIIRTIQGYADQDANDLVDRMVNKVVFSLVSNDPESVRNMVETVETLTFDHGSYRNPEIVTSDRFIFITFDLSFNPDSLFRDSFSPNFNGVKNILKLLERGYRIDSKRLPSGEWHGEKRVALRSREGSGAIHEAIEEFNRDSRSNSIATVMAYSNEY